VEYHTGALAALCLAELYHTLTVTGSIPQLRFSTKVTLEIILIYVVNKTKTNVCCFAVGRYLHPLSTACDLRNHKGR
jgi:hypothetical protein